MKKIPTLFVRDLKTHKVIPEVTDGCMWVLHGEGRATRKFDGTCCMIDEHRGLWKRREVKKGREDPEGFVLSEEDSNTGKRFGWVTVGDGKEDQWFNEAVAGLEKDDLPPGTYELVGPKVQGNPESYDEHTLIAHGAVSVDCPRGFETIAEWLQSHSFEGVVFHRGDGTMAKIKRKDFP